jgi:hypothetical protein
MPQDRRLVAHLHELLRGGHAHGTFEDVVDHWPEGLRGTLPTGAAHTAWQLVEHLRICQSDILEFSRSASHVSPKFPEGYWPTSPAPPEASAWDRSVAAFRADREAMEALVADPATDLLARIPHGDGQTILREALMLADHNAYHLGQLVLLRRLLGAWTAD